MGKPDVGVPSRERLCGVVANHFDLVPARTNDMSLSNNGKNPPRATAAVAKGETIPTPNSKRRKTFAFSFKGLSASNQGRETLSLAPSRLCSNHSSDAALSSATPIRLKLLQIVENGVVAAPFWQAPAGALPLVANQLAYYRTRRIAPGLLMVLFASADLHSSLKLLLPIIVISCATMRTHSPPVEPFPAYWISRDAGI